MGSNVGNYATIGQNFMNNVIQQDQQNCIATSQSSANNNVVIISGANIGGDLTGVAAVNGTDASCLMVSNMDASVSNILSASLQQSNAVATDAFGDFSYTDTTNQFNINQSVTNNISQINEATCAANTVTATNNNYIYVSNTRVGGNFIGVTSKASASANCTMTNTMKAVTYNQAQASATQSNTVVGMWVAIAAAIAGIIGLMVFGVIILFATGAIGKVGYSAASAYGQGKSSIDSTLLAARQLGLTPEVLALATGRAVPKS